MEPDDSHSTDSCITRRKLLAGVGVAGASTAGVAALTAQPVRADVALGELEVDSDSADVDGPPEAVTVAVSGRVDVTAADPPEMITTHLQAVYDETVEVLAESAVYDTTATDYALEGDLLEHSEVDAAAITPDDAGATKTTAFTVEVVAQAVAGGSILAEERIGTDTSVTLTNAGTVVAVGGTGSVRIEE
jgi:hypothetical protein